MNKDSIVISGISGFVGNHLARELYNSNFNIIGIGTQPTVNPNISDIVDYYYQADLTKAWPDIKNVKAVINLAGLAAVGPSFDNPQTYINNNSAIVTNLCEFYLKQEHRPRIIIVSSGAVYNPKQPMPISEVGELGLTSPYTISKILTEHQAEYYCNRGLDCVVVRPFNHIGPGQNKGFILPDFYDRLITLQENEDTIITGNINTRRDYTDVRDIVKAYKMIIEAPHLKHNIYNICSGKSLSGKEILDILKTKLDLSNIESNIDQSLIRPTDIDNIVGDSSRLNDELGWLAQININQTITDFIESKDF